MATFVERIKADKYVEWFENSYQLAAEVAEALHNEMAKGNRPGWVRGTQSEVEDKIDELIRLLRHELADATDTAEDDDDWDEPVREYDFTGFRVPTDGKHREVGWNGDPIGEGEYKDGNLVRGVEYDVLVHVTSGSLIYKPDCPDDPYDASDGFTYEKMESYGRRMLPRAFGASEAYIVEDGIDQYYVADIEVDEVNEHMTNIRTLEEFLKQKDPEQLQLLRDSIEDDEY